DFYGIKWYIAVSPSAKEIDEVNCCILARHAFEVALRYHVAHHSAAAHATWRSSSLSLQSCSQIHQADSSRPPTL
ncbi:hypothetical protein Dimus_037139, partial [Dionaea muscipula]